VAEPDLVEPTIASVVGVEETGSGSLADALHERLRSRRALLVLDNFEHVTAAAPAAAALLAAAPGLKLLVTSRAVLRLSGEHDYPVPPLSLPTAGGAVEASEAVELFAQRARAARPGFALEEHARAVAEICVALDGLPLALELAAARTRVLSPEDLRDRLERRLPLLERGPADLPERQRTLRATIEWSHELLGEGERRLLARLAVFAGGWNVEAAEAVCDADLDALTSLVEQSLARRRPDGRFSMLQTVREYGLERLEALGEGEPTRARHAEHFLALAEAAEERLTGADAAQWFERLEADLDNLRAALAWTGSSGETELELRLATALRRFWHVRGHITEGRRWLDDAIGRRHAAAPEVQARALVAASALLYDEEELDRAEALLEEALALFRQAGDERAAARALSELGGIAALREDYVRASALFQETLPFFRAAGDTRALLVTLSNLASVTDLAGDHVRGRELGEETLVLARESGDRDQVTISLHNLARGALREGRREDARTLLSESVDVALELGFRSLIASCLEAFAEIWLADGDVERAARLLGASGVLLDEVGGDLGPEERAGRAATAAEIERRLGAAAVAGLTAEGARLPPSDAVSLARFATADERRTLGDVLPPIENGDPGDETED
jgi:non-specific serine/threonine protein kinase